MHALLQERHQIISETNTQPRERIFRSGSESLLLLPVEIHDRRGHFRERFLQAFHDAPEDGQRRAKPQLVERGQDVVQVFGERVEFQKALRRLVFVLDSGFPGDPRVVFVDEGVALYVALEVFRGAQRGMLESRAYTSCKNGDHQRAEIATYSAK